MTERTEMPLRVRPSSRCTDRKHVVENGQPACDCKALILWPTAARNALVVTLPPGTTMPATDGRP